MDGAAGEDHAPGTPELKRTYLSLLPHAALVDLVLGIDAGTATAFPGDLRSEVRRMQAAADDADGEGSPDPQPTPTPRAPSVPPAGGPRTRAGAARAYAAALAKESARPSPAPGGISFPQTPEPAPPPFAPVPQPYPSLVVHLPGGSPPAPTTPTTGPPSDPWQSPQADSNAGPMRNTPAKKTRTGVIGGYNPITSIGPSNEGLPSYEEMIVLALMENQDGQGIAPKDVFAWMSARWPLNANFRPSASQALQKAYKRGRLEKVGTKYKLNPNWHGGATTNRTTRRPQSMAELPGNYAWAPPPLPPVASIPPDPRVRSNSVVTPAPVPVPAPAQPPPPQPTDFDAHAQVASLLKALQEAGPSNPAPNPVNGTDQNQNPNPAPVGDSQPQHLTHLAMPQPGSAPAPVPVPGQASPVAPVPPPAGSPTVATPLQHPIPQPPPVPIQGGMPPPPPQPQPQPQPQQNPITAPPPHPHPVAAGHPVPLTYQAFHSAPTALQASLATLASQLANMSKTNQGGA